MLFCDIGQNSSPLLPAYSLFIYTRAGGAKQKHCAASPTLFSQPLKPLPLHRPPSPSAGPKQMKAGTESNGADYEKAQSKRLMMVVQEKERNKKGGESRSQETCNTEHRARQSAACGNGARCVGHRNALHLPSQRTASPNQQSNSTTWKPMTIRLHHQGRDEEDDDDARRKTMVIWF